jgi:preprotein translocase subunit Sec61beta
MAERINISTPSGSAGIFRFYDEEGGGIKLTPELVIGVAVVFLLGILVLQFAIR